MNSDDKHIDNLETLVVRLARWIEKHTDGDSVLASQAMDYMRREARGAQAILRAAPMTERNLASHGVAVDDSQTELRLADDTQKVADEATESNRRDLSTTPDISADEAERNAENASNKAAVTMHNLSSDQKAESNT